MVSQTIISNNGNHKLTISTINNHLFIYHECGFEFTTYVKRRIIFQAWNPATWGGGFKWVQSNNAMQPNILDLQFIMGNGTIRNPNDFNPTQTRRVGHYKTSAVSINATDPAQNDVSWITNVSLRFAYENSIVTI